MRDNAAVEGLGERRVVLGDGARLLADGVEDILETAFTEELVAGAERNLDSGAELDEVLSRLVLDFS